MDFPFKREGTIPGFLGVELKEMMKERVVLAMPVNERSCQYTGHIHGGGSVMLAETAAGVGAMMNIDRDKQRVVGLEVNANHVRGADRGFVTATARPYFVGRTTSVWEVKVANEEGKLVSAVRCTIAHVAK
jgi:1,4-dihydroxy-2-naphthoyl-CoA hydrolase